MIVPDPERLQAVIDGLSIHVVGQENKVSLAGRNVEFVFLSADEDTFTLPYYVAGGGSDAYRYGAFETEDGMVQVVIQMARYMSTFYSYDSYMMEMNMVYEGVIAGLQRLVAGRNNVANVSGFESQFLYDSEYDANNPGSIKNRTWMMNIWVVNPRRGDGATYLNLDYYRKMAGEGWIPEEYLSLVLPNG